MTLPVPVSHFPGTCTYVPLGGVSAPHHLRVLPKEHAEPGQQPQVLTNNSCSLVENNRSQRNFSSGFSPRQSRTAVGRCRLCRAAGCTGRQHCRVWSVTALDPRLTRGSPRFRLGWKNKQHFHLPYSLFPKTGVISLGRLGYFHVAVVLLGQGLYKFHFFPILPIVFPQ